MSIPRDESLRKVDPVRCRLCGAITDALVGGECRDCFETHFYDDEEESGRECQYCEADLPPGSSESICDWCREELWDAEDGEDLDWEDDDEEDEDL